MISIDVVIQNEYFMAAATLSGAILAAMLFHFILRVYLYNMAKKTKTDIDDRILKIAYQAAYPVAIIAGLYFAVNSLSISEPYLHQINNAIFIIAVFMAAAVLSRLVAVLIQSNFVTHNHSKQMPKLLNKIVSVMIYLIAAIMVLGYFKVEISPLIATLGIGGLAIGLALQGTLSNFFAGLHILSDKPVNVGDFVELEGNISGYIEDIGWRSTRIRTLPNNIVIIPNAKLADSVITNESMPQPEMAALVQCGVSYDSDLDKVEKVTTDVAKKIQKTVPGAVKDFEPFIRYHTFGDSNINFSVILRVNQAVDKYLITHEFIKALKKRYDKEKIEISWPVRKIYKGR